VEKLLSSGMKTKVFQFGNQTYIGELIFEDETHYHFDNLKWLILTPDGQIVVMKALLGFAQGPVKVPKNQIIIADASLEAVKSLMGPPVIPNQNKIAN